MNTQPLELEANLETTTTEAETETLAQAGFTSEEIVSLLWLRQWYQTRGSDRAPMVRYLEFLRLLVRSGELEL